MVHVIILNVTRHTHHVDQLKQLFSSFTIDVIDCHALSEYDRMVKALKIARQGEDACLIIQSNSVCYKDHVDDMIQRALDSKADIINLCAYNDVCHRYQHAEEDMYYSNTISSTQAILFKHHVIDAFYESLKQHCNVILAMQETIEKQDYQCLVFLPNVIEFDIMIATSHEDYLKLNRCITKVEEENEATATEIVWAILIGMLIVLLIILVPYYKNKKY